MDDLATQEPSIYFVWDFAVVKEEDIVGFFEEDFYIRGLMRIEGVRLMVWRGVNKLKF